MDIKARLGYNTTQMGNSSQGDEEDHPIALCERCVSAVLADGTGYAKTKHVKGGRMAKQDVSPEVHRFLSENGKKGAKIGGATTKRLVELGKQAASEPETTNKRRKSVKH